MIVYPPAKINIGLYITERRFDGFHNLETLFVPVHGITDILEIKRSNEEGVQMDCTGLPIPGKEKIVRTAAEWSLAQSDCKGLRIHLHKRIPMGAGLGGGSSDGAYALKACAEILELKLSNEELETQALKLGSDCPFFLKSGWQIGKGRGEKLTPFSASKQNFYIVLINPGIHISTAKAFSKIRPSTAAENWLDSVRQGFSEPENVPQNDFEGYAFEEFPILNEIKKELYSSGALYASMSGSGSSIYGLFNQKPEVTFSFQSWVVFSGPLS